MALRILFVGAIILGAGAASSQDFPNKPIRIVTTAPGGGADFAARIVGQGMSGGFNQPIVIENRAGGSATSAETVAKAPPDGYSMLVAGGALWTAPLIRKMPYDVVQDFSPVSLLVREVLVVVVNPSVPAKSIKELIELAKAKPGALNYGASSIGSTSHLAAELFKSMAGVNIINVPYKGGGAALIGLLGGETQLSITDAGNVAPHVKAGKLRILAVTSAAPSALVPGLPTVADSGLPGYEAVGWTGIWAPAKTPRAIIARLNQEIVRVLNLADVKEKFLNAGVEVVGSSPEQFAATIKSEIAKTSKVIKVAGIKAD